MTPLPTLKSTPRGPTLKVTFSDYTIYLSQELPDPYAELCETAALCEKVNLDGAADDLLYLAVSRAHDWPFLVIVLRYAPGSKGGFLPGVLLVPQTQVLFVGAGERLLAYRLDQPEKLWEDSADIGFLSWEQYDNYAIMSAELELATWDLDGNKLWSTFVKPPWAYTIHTDRIFLDVMGVTTNFPIQQGPSSRTSPVP